MQSLSVIYNLVADTGSPASILQHYMAPVFTGMCIFAGIICVFFLVNGGIQYMASSGQPEKLAAAKVIIRNALVGLAIVLAAGVLTAILSHAFYHTATPLAPKLPSLASITPTHYGPGLIGVLLKAVTGVINDIVQSAAYPFLKALQYFTSGTPLISGNSDVFNLWLAIAGMADILFVAVVALLGFHIMSFASFGLEEVDIRRLLPQLVLIFALINSSVLLIDGLISLSNVMIRALLSGFSTSSVWNVLTIVTQQSSAYGLAALIIMLAFLIFAVVLCVYYVGRIVTIYVGAVLSPLVLLLWLLPNFRDFAINAAKVYFFTIFVLFVHVVILTLSASLFSGLIASSPTHTPNQLMALIIGLATLISLLKAQGVMTQLSYTSMSLKTARKLGGQFITGISYFAGVSRDVGMALSESPVGQTMGTKLRSLQTSSNKLRASLSPVPVGATSSPTSRSVNSSVNIGKRPAASRQTTKPKTVSARSKKP